MRELGQDTVTQMEMMSEAMKNADEQTVGEAVSNMQREASELAGVLSNGNPVYDRQELERMMMMQANAAREEMNLMLDGRYPQALMTYEDAADQRMRMADYLTDGLIRNFYQAGE